jgi:hypothetical protein
MQAMIGGREDIGPAKAMRKTEPAFIEAAQSAPSKARFNYATCLGAGSRIARPGMNVFRRSSQCANRDTSGTPFCALVDNPLK